MSGHSVTIPDDQAFASFKAECLCEEDWTTTYNKGGITVWVQAVEEGKSIHKIKVRPSQIICKDVSAATMYDVLHDLEYRKKWDTNVEETFDIGKLTVNADVGYYAWKCPKPLRNRDKYPPKKDFVRASQGPNSCILTYMAHLTFFLFPGSLPKWVVNKASQFLAPRVISMKYTEWKQKHNPGFKPWLYPEQNTLPSIPLSELSLQRAESLEKLDASSCGETQEREDSD
uniref:START domain-containing protein n=1 Tax=Gouania willdenowi TaxID=441366 RepID=A0A8C5ERA7_GOUWI